VAPEGVMKATAHWLELKGHRPKSPSILFDEVFSEQVFATGKIEEGRTLRNFFKRTGQPLMQDWVVEMVKRMIRHLPIRLLTIMGLANFIRPRTKGWGPARAAIEEYVHEQEAKQRQALGLDELVKAAERNVTDGKMAEAAE
jgi:heterodisulfide reductase subunit C